MTLLIVLVKNYTIKAREGIDLSYGTFQISLIDRSGYQEKASLDEDVPGTIVFIAVAVGGLISIFCIAMIVWLVVKALRKRNAGDEKEDS